MKELPQKMTVSFSTGDRDLIEKIADDAEKQDRSRSQIVKRIAQSYYNRKNAIS